MHNGNQLGPVGSRIIVEVFMRLMLENEDSFLYLDEWEPRFGAQVGEGTNYKIVDLLRFAGTYPIPGIS